MTGKRWEIIDEEFISYTGGTAQLISNGECEIHLWERPKDAQLFCDKLNAFNNENEQLQVRNDRQAKRLGELYELMAKKDWESLTKIIDDFKRCEEQLQREWRTYE